VGDLVVDGHLRGTQGALVFAVGIGHALLRIGQGLGGVITGRISMPVWYTKRDRLSL
jgi:hypothetical protein